MTGKTEGGGLWQLSVFYFLKISVNLKLLKHEVYLKKLRGKENTA